MGRRDRLIAATLLIAALGLAGVQGARVMAFRQLDPFRGRVSGMESMHAFRADIERCDVRSGRLRVQGWIARPGVVRGRHATRILLRDRDDGRLFVVRTDLTARLDVHQRLAAELHDGIDYTSSGFAAWVDLAKTKPAIADARVYIAYDEGGPRAGERYVLVPTACATR